ncbi:MAG TPA: DUF1015 domain-containing protein [Candidatus Dormibacteraeota bacterium]|nr:DUF1015 domain-containing protein [Candidatus Dormibacteraeota bacterium]
MARVIPFRGLRYDPNVVELGDVLAPPYDVVDDDLRQQLMARALQNVIRFEAGPSLPDDRPGVRDRYTRARDHLAAWRTSGAVLEERGPALYLYSHAFRPPGGGPLERIGCFAAVGLEPWSAGVVLRHEHTLTGPKADRLALLRVTGVQGSPVFALYEGAEAATTAIRRRMATVPPDAEAVTQGEHGRERHRLWVVTDPELIGTITQALAPARLFIADGHHRYETALAYREEGREGAGPGAPGREHVLMLLTPLDDPSHVILPGHRIVPEALVSAAALVAALEAGGYGAEPVAGVGEALERMAARRGAAHAFGVVGPEGVTVVHRPRRPAAGPAQGLDVTVLQEEVLERHCGLDSGAIAAGRLEFTRDPAVVQERVAAARGLGFLVNPTTVEEVVAVATADQSMPQKSTYFLPKVPTGLVLYPTR